MAFENVFERYELKYLLNPGQYDTVRRIMEPYMIPDAYGVSTVNNIYYDTPDFRMIRRSLEKPVYKEKFRLRSYGTASPDSTTFVELKKKFKKVVYKRRFDLPEAEAVRYLSGDLKLDRTQIQKEVNYVLDIYPGIAPRVKISSDRCAFYGKEDHGFRITFDRNILWRDYDLSLCRPAYGEPLLAPGQVLMEVKISRAMPLWLACALSGNRIFRTNFSKYGRAYEEMQRKIEKGVMLYA